jgi:hypothetical protein
MGARMLPPIFPIETGSSLNPFTNDLAMYPTLARLT